LLADLFSYLSIVQRLIRFYFVYLVYVYGDYRILRILVYLCTHIMVTYLNTMNEWYCAFTPKTFAPKMTLRNNFQHKTRTRIRFRERIRIVVWNFRSQITRSKTIRRKFFDVKTWNWMNTLWTYAVQIVTWT